MRKDPVDIVAATLQPTERCGVLDETKKNLIIVLIGRGASRREAAGYVKCHHTTIGRTAARDPAFAAKLNQNEMAASLARNGMIHRAATDPKYWRAAAWMLERRNPEDYAKRSPNTYTADQVQSLLASVCTAALATVQPEKIAEFHSIFDDAFDEIDSKQTTHVAPRDAESTHLAPRDVQPLNGAAPSRNGHHPPQAPPAAEAAAVAPEPPAAAPEAASLEWPSEPAGEGVGNLSTEEETFANDEFDLDLDTGDDSDDDPDFDWDRYEALQDAECRYVTAEAVPDPEERIAANRAVRIALIAARLRGEAKPDLVHHPINRVAKSMSEDASRNQLLNKDLRQYPESRTTAETTQGRCTNGTETAVCEAIPAPAAAATSG
jgi:hypothetical protein